MPPGAAFTLGVMLGIAATLLIQAFGRSKFRQALSMARSEIDLTAGRSGEAADRRTLELEGLKRRLAVLERITIDPAVRTAREIEQLRIEAN